MQFALTRVRYIYIIYIWRETQLLEDFFQNSQKLFFENLSIAASVVQLSYHHKSIYLYTWTTTKTKK